MNIRALLPLALLIVAAPHLLADSTAVPPCPLPTLPLVPASDGELEAIGITWQGRYVEGWRSPDDDCEEKKLYAVVISRETRGKMYTPHWDIIIHVALYYRPPGPNRPRGNLVRSIAPPPVGWKPLEHYAIKQEVHTGEEEVGYIQRSCVMADADTNGVPEVYLCLTSSTADGGGWDEAVLSTQVLAAGKRYALYVPQQGAPGFYSIYNAAGRVLTQVEEAATPPITFARCHQQRAYVVRDFRNEAFGHW